MTGCRPDLKRKIPASTGRVARQPAPLHPGPPPRFSGVRPLRYGVQTLNRVSRNASSTAPVCETDGTTIHEGPALSGLSALVEFVARKP